MAACSGLETRLAEANLLEAEELDQAVKTALAYQRTHPYTLVVVTGDHAHSTQIVMDNYGGSATATVTTVYGDSPSDGLLLPKDEIVSVDGVAMKEPKQVAEAIRAKSAAAKPGS